jgi:nucleotide-binding universal stress UspA family protein
MYQRILVPVDGSATSIRGLDEAIRIASARNARLRLLNVIDDTLLVPAAYANPVGDLGDVIDSLAASGRSALELGTKRAAKRGVQVEQAQVRAGLRAVSDVILREARKWRADLLVMGTHGRRGVKRLVLGSDAERVLREALVPVLLVRATDADDERARPTSSRKAARKPRSRRTARK